MAPDDADRSPERGAVEAASSGESPSRPTAGRGSEPEPPSTGGAILPPERYLLAGERLVERIDVGSGWVVATTHRVVVFDPDDGTRTERFVAIDRPNVVGVRTGGGGDPRLLGYVSRAAVSALLLLGSGAVAESVGLRTLFDTDLAPVGAPGVAGLTSMLAVAGDLLGLLVDVFLVGGSVAAVAAFLLAGAYLRRRRPTLVIERAGGDDVVVRLPSRQSGERAVETLARALADELAVGR
jgi:hypothetical protein